MRWYEDTNAFQTVQKLRDAHNTWGYIRECLIQDGWDDIPISSLRRQYHDEQQNATRLTSPVSAPSILLPSDTDLPRFPDKNYQTVNWREWLSAAQTMQELKSKSSHSQDRGVIDFSERTRDLCLVPLCDWHVGSWGTDYAGWLQTSDEILAEEDIFFCSLGDMTQMSIVFRSMLEIADNLFPPQIQQEIHESWLDDMIKKLLFGTWDNHSVMREEKAVGYSRYAKAYQDRCLYFNGIGHVDLKLGDETYKIAASHKFRGSSFINPTHSQMRYLRMEGHDREIAIAGDSHVPAMAKYVEGSRLLTALNGGSMQVNSGYGKRHFSLFTWREWPCIVFRADTHVATPYFTIEEWLHTKHDS